MKSAEKSAQTLKNFPSSSPEVTTKNNDSQFSPRLSGVSASTSCDQDGVPCPGSGGEARGRDQARFPLTPAASPASEAARCVRGLLLSAGGRRQRLRFAGSRSVASRSAARDLPPGTSTREGQGTFANSRRDWMRRGGREKARRGERKGRSGAGEPGWQPPREQSERAAGAGGAEAAAQEAAAAAAREGGRRRGRRQPGSCERGAAVAGSARLCWPRGWTAEPTPIHRWTRPGRGRQRTQDAVPQGTPLQAAN